MAVHENNKKFEVIETGGSGLAMDLNVENWAMVKRVSSAEKKWERFIGGQTGKNFDTR